MLIATQRLSTVEVADRAVVVDDGVIVEAGTPTELLARRGVFWSLLGKRSVRLHRRRIDQSLGNPGIPEGTRRNGAPG